MTDVTFQAEQPSWWDPGQAYLGMVSAVSGRTFMRHNSLCCKSFEASTRWADNLCVSRSGTDSAPNQVL